MRGCRWGRAGRRRIRILVGWAAANRFGERVGLTPQGEDRLLQAGNVDRGVDPSESGLVGQCSQVFRVVGPGIVGISAIPVT